MSELDLDAIEARAKAFPFEVKGLPWVHPVDDIPALVAEVRRLRERVSAVLALCDGIETGAQYGINVGYGTDHQQRQYDMERIRTALGVTA